MKRLLSFSESKAVAEQFSDRYAKIRHAGLDRLLNEGDIYHALIDDVAAVIPKVHQYIDFERDIAKDFFEKPTRKLQPFLLHAKQNLSSLHPFVKMYFEKREAYNALDIAIAIDSTPDLFDAVIEARHHVNQRARLLEAYSTMNENSSRELSFSSEDPLDSVAHFLSSSTKERSFIFPDVFIDRVNELSLYLPKKSLDLDVLDRLQEPETYVGGVATISLHQSPLVSVTIEALDDMLQATIATTSPDKTYGHMSVIDYAPDETRLSFVRGSLTNFHHSKADLVFKSVCDDTSLPGCSESCEDGIVPLYRPLKNSHVPNIHGRGTESAALVYTYIKKHFAEIYSCATNSQ